ncbi:peroxidase family protein [Roseibium sp.]|uniref:peroxidase family protein n=1 Tax=Roseibium sp. TaxID=1936156 RepID=UPI003B525FE6
MRRSDQTPLQNQPNQDPAPEQNQGPNGPRGADGAGLARIQANLIDNLANRSVDGSNSHETNIDWGATGQQLLRLTAANYTDGIGTVATDLPNARAISNAVAEQTEDEPNSFGLSDMFWVWGQFIDHDITLTGEEGFEFSPITVPAGDSDFDPAGTGEAIIPFTRTGVVEGTGTDSARQYSNGITSFLDASMVYGSDADTAAALRGDGGKLLLTEDNLLVETEGGVLAGDVRAAENVALTSMHTVFAREHNLWVERFARQDPGMSDDELYDAARIVVEAEIQAITFNEFLPLLLGEDAITAYEGYDPNVNPGISVEFATAAFRFGHSLLSSNIQRLDSDGNTIAAGDLSLSEAFFNPSEISENGGIDPLLRGLADNTAQELDTQVVEDVRSFLFGAPGSGGLDLAALNIERGRDLGVASYNDLREALGLTRATSFSDITSDATVAAQLASVYTSVDQVDAWIGGLAEDPAGSGIVGELFATILLDQFLRLRDGDPFWSQGLDLPQAQIDALWSTSLADVIERNSDIRSLQDDVMLAYDRIGGTNGDDALTGADGRDLILGNRGNDVLDGAGGDDQLEGQDGNDTLFGQAGNDVLYGGDGADTLVGGAGNDELDGGRGNDTFVFEGDFGSDIVERFGTGDRGGDDLLQVSVDGFATAEAVLALAAETQAGTVLQFSDDLSITLLGVSVAQLDLNDIQII